MKANRINLITDVSFLSFVVLFFTTVSFLTLDRDFLNINLVLLCITGMVMILTYFTNLVVGISTAAVVLLGGIAVTLYLGLEKGIPVPGLLYFWGMMLPGFTLCTGYLSRNSSRLQHTVTALEKNIAELVTIDDLTGLKNQKQFMSDTDAYMHIARRYNLKLALMVAELRYQDDVERIVGKQNMGDIVIHVSQALQQSVRSEDLVYIVDTQRFCFAVLMITNDYGGIQVAIDRTKKRISSINLEEVARFSNVDLNMRIGYVTLEQDYPSALDFLNAAKQELAYDV